MVQARRQLRTRNAGGNQPCQAWKSRVVAAGMLALSASGIAGCRAEFSVEPIRHEDRARKCVAPKTEQVARLRDIVAPVAGNDEGLLSHLTEMANDRSEREVGIMIDLSRHLAALGMKGSDIYSAIIQLEDPYREMALPVKRAPTFAESRALSRIMRRASHVSEHDDGTSTSYRFGARYDRSGGKMVITCEIEWSGEFHD